MTGRRIRRWIIGWWPEVLWVFAFYSSRGAVFADWLGLIALHYVNLKSLMYVLSIKHTFTFFLLHVRHPPLDLRCGFLLTNPVLRRAI